MELVHMNGKEWRTVAFNTVDTPYDFLIKAELGARKDSWSVIEFFTTKDKPEAFKIENGFVNAIISTMKTLHMIVIPAKYIYDNFTIKVNFRKGVHQGHNGMLFIIKMRKKK